ncbi:TMEM165/GDT1 family protein [Sphingomonas sp. H39-1-10]|uniref:TMEM165/GDT1 family protein n=1 Tax=Sphingomonas TaxID=13687 RepID=UPI00210D2B3A|nr:MULTISPECIES: TMEM165/GDT1 family protein [Sphingomonas]MDF0487054.1 TMEM165/GDT1 family protein [Sphingomonas pollutisoli]
MAAFVAALVIEVGDRAPWLAAILGDRFARRGTVIAATVLALALGNGIAGAGGGLVAAHLTPNARALLVSVALLSAGLGAFGRLKAPERLVTWRTGAFATSFLGVAILAFGDRTQFATMAFAARGDAPVLAAIGATLGAGLVNAAAVLTGERMRKRLPIRAIRIGTGLLLCAVGAISGVSALRLI